MGSWSPLGWGLVVFLLQLSVAVTNLLLSPSLLAHWESQTCSQHGVKLVLSLGAPQHPTSSWDLESSCMAGPAPGVHKILLLPPPLLSQVASKAPLPRGLPAPTHPGHAPLERAHLLSNGDFFFLICFALHCWKPPASHHSGIFHDDSWDLWFPGSCVLFIASLLFWPFPESRKSVQGGSARTCRVLHPGPGGVWGEVSRTGSFPHIQVPCSLPGTQKLGTARKARMNELTDGQTDGWLGGQMHREMDR